MTQKDSDFRNNFEKCLYNNTGFCKFRTECRKQHLENVCQIENCDRKCLNRHPKPCKHKHKCKFLAKNICAFSHVDDTLEPESLEPGSEMLERMDKLEQQIDDNKIRHEKDINELHKIVKEHQNQIKDLIEQKNKDFDEKLKEEIKKVKNIFAEQKLELKSFHEKKYKELENKFNVEAKKIKNVCNQTTKALEGNIVKDSEAFRKETKVISDKLEEAEKSVRQLKEYIEKVKEVKESQSKEV